MMRGFHVLEYTDCVRVYEGAAGGCAPLVKVQRSSGRGEYDYSWYRSFDSHSERDCVFIIMIRSLSHGLNEQTGSLLSEIVM